MDAGIADTINRLDVQKIAVRLDEVDAQLLPGMILPVPWYRAAIAASLMDENDAHDADRAWLFGILASNTLGLHFDGEPADGDWDNLYANFRAEIVARRDPEAHRVGDQLPCVVV